jgi:hypothetical protein
MILTAFLLQAGSWTADSSDRQVQGGSQSHKRSTIFYLDQESQIGTGRFCEYESTLIWAVHYISGRTICALRSVFVSNGVPSGLDTKLESVLITEPSPWTK